MPLMVLASPERLQGWLLALLPLLEYDVAGGRREREEGLPGARGPENNPEGGAADDEEEEVLVSKITYRKYLKGQYIVQQNDICKKQCFIISGCTKRVTE